MSKFEYMTCMLDLKGESAEQFLNRINKLGEKKWESVCIIPSLLSDFYQILMKRKKEEYNV